MANSDTPFGLVPKSHSNGAPYNGAVRPYYLPSTYATATYVGDPVVITGTSNTAQYLDWKPGSLPEINKATAAGGNYITGVIVGFELDRDNLTRQYNAASTERVAFVCDDPDVIFEIQEDGDTTPLAATSVGLNADLIYTNTGDTASGISGAELDSTTANTTNTLQLKVHRIVQRDNNAIGAFAKWEVTINLHTQRYLTGI